MTQLGKILVFVTVALSFVMLGLAAGLYLNRIDWALKTPPKPGEPPTALEVAQKRVKDGTSGLESARTHWDEELKGYKVADPPNRAGLLAWEKKRDADYAWYQEQLNAVRSGPGGKRDVPIKRIALQDGAVIPDPQNAGRPTMVDATRRKAKGEGRQPGDELYCYEYYTAKDIDIPDNAVQRDKLRNLPYLSEQLRLASEAFQKAVQEDAKLTDDVIGPKGLRQQIIDEQEKYARVEEELKNVQGRQTNGRVETELLLSRRAQLQRRINELKRTAAEEKN